MPERKLNGRELMLAERWDEALQAFNQEIEAGKVLFYNFMWRGLLYRHLNEVDTAIADFSAAINSPIDRGSPYAGYWDAFYYRGNAYLVQREFAQAETDHNRYVDLISEHNEKKLEEHLERHRRYKTTPTPLNPANYPPLGLSFSNPQDCRLALADYDFATANTHATPPIYFCMGAAYECLRDYLRAVECYRKIDTVGNFLETVKIATARSQEAALYVEPTDKQLLRPGIEYLTIHGDMDEDSFTCHYFDLDGDRQEVVKGIPKPSRDWKMMARRSAREGYNAYYQRKK